MRAIPIDLIRFAPAGPAARFAKGGATGSRRALLRLAGGGGLVAAMLAIGLAASPVLAQPMPGMPGGTVGLPANPFASNYPSEPPGSAAADGSDGAAASPRRMKRSARSARRPVERPVPPGSRPAR